MSLGENRVEDLEEALRRIVTVISPDSCHACCDRDAAVLEIAADALGLDPVVLVPAVGPGLSRVTR